MLENPGTRRIFFISIIVGIGVILPIIVSLIFSLPIALGVPQIDLTNVFATCIGIAVGVVITWMFEELKKGQEKAQREQFMVLLYPIFINAYKLGHYTVMLTNVKSLHKRNVMTPHRRNLIMKSILELCEALGIEKAGEEAARFLNPEKGQTREQERIVVNEYSQVKKVLGEAVALKHGSRVKSLYDLGTTIANVLEAISPDDNPVGSDISKEFEDDMHGGIIIEKENKLLASLKVVYAENKVYDYCEKSFQLLSRQNNDKGTITKRKLQQFLMLVDYFFRYQGEMHDRREKLEKFLSGNTTLDKVDFHTATRALVNSFIDEEEIERQAEEARLLTNEAFNAQQGYHTAVADELYEQGLASCERVLISNPNHVQALHDKSFCLFKLNRFKESLDVLHTVTSLENNPYNSWAIYQSGVLLYNIGEQELASGNTDKAIPNFKEALRHLKESLQINPNYAHSWGYMGLIYYDMARSPHYPKKEHARETFKQACAAWKEAVKVDPDYAQAWLGLAFAFNYLREYDQALEAAEKAIAMTPQIGQAWEAKIYALLRPQPKEEELDLYLDLDTLEKAIAVLDNERLEQCLGVTEQALQLFPTRQDFLKQKVLVLLGLGKVTEENFLALDLAIYNDQSDQEWLKLRARAVDRLKQERVKH